MVKKIEQEITKAFVNFSKKDEIELENVRVLILKKEGQLIFHLRQKNVETNKVEQKRPTNLNEMIGFAYTMLVEKPLYNSVKSLFEKNNTNEQQAYVILLLNKEQVPMVDLYIGGVKTKRLTIQELIN